MAGKEEEGKTTETTNHNHFTGKLNSPPLPHRKQRAGSSPQGRRPRGLGAGPARAPSRLGQSLETERNFPERKRRVGAGPAACSAPASTAPQLPESQEAPAPPAGPERRPGAPHGKRAGRRTAARQEPNSGRCRGGARGRPARRRSPSAPSPRSPEESYLRREGRAQEDSRGPKPTAAALSPSSRTPRKKWAARRPRPRPAPRPRPRPRPPFPAPPSGVLFPAPPAAAPLSRPSLWE